jgi:phosphate transport system protein
MPIRTVLERSLEETNDNLLRIASMVEFALANATQALVERNGELAHQVSASDAAINRLRFVTEEACYNMLAMQQPNSRDLRIIVGAVSVATNLERIGDHAAGVARLTLRMLDRPLLKPLVDIPQMAEIARSMVKSSVGAFITRDVTAAEAVIARDAEIDTIHSRVYRELIDFMTRDAGAIERATFLLWVSHNIERIGDRSTNICERAIYVATGQLKEYPTR